MEREMGRGRGSASGRGRGRRGRGRGREKEREKERGRGKERAWAVLVAGTALACGASYAVSVLCADTLCQYCALQSKCVGL
eukprot:3935715-Rhodomonas_salina.2